MSRPRLPALLSLVGLIAALAPTTAAVAAPTASVSGVFAGSGPRPSDIRINAVSSTPGAGEVVRVDPDGRYRIAGLEPGTYQLIVTSVDEKFATRSVTVADGEQRTGVDFAYGAVTGTLRDTAGAPLSDADVAATGLDAGPPGRAVTTDARGRWTIGFLPLGQYRVSFYNGPGWQPGWWRGQTSAATANPVTVRADTVAVADDVLRRSSLAVVSGSVRTPAGTGPVDVRLLDARGRLVDVTVTSGGRYRFVDVPAGRYVLDYARAAGEVRVAGEYYREVREVRGLRAATRVRVTTSNRALRTVTLARGGVLRGRVVDAGGRPRAGVLVKAVGRGHTARYDYTDDRGRYAVTGLSGGRYRLFAQRVADDTAPRRAWWPRSTPTRAGASFLRIGTGDARRLRSLVLR